MLGRTRLLAVLAFSLALTTSAAAAGDQPDLVSLGIGQFDETFLNPYPYFMGVDYNSIHDSAVDFRAEYIFGENLVPISPYGSLRPQLGFEMTSKGSLFFTPALMLDLPLGPFHFTPSFGPGLYIRGGGKRLGYPLEFRTQLEVSYEFDNHARVGVALSHMSNGRLFATWNPGEDSVLAYFQFPIQWIYPN